MAKKGWTWIFYCAFSINVWSFIVISSVTADLEDFNPSRSFHAHEIVQPIVVGGRAKRDVIENEHEDEMTLSLPLTGRNFLVDLEINRDLLPNHHFEKIQVEGKYVINKPLEKTSSHCYYKGRVRGVKGSWVAVSTCNGVNGVIYDGKELHYIAAKNSSDIENDHFVYRHSDFNGTSLHCGYEDNAKKPSNHSLFHKRVRRSSAAQTIDGPYNSNSKSRYVELVIVSDNKLFKDMKSDVNAVISRAKDIANIANALYSPLNIFIALVGVVVWSEFDEINLSTDGDTTLTNFLHYRRQRLVRDHPNDNAQLITGIAFNGGVVGKALKGPICTYEFSGGVNMDHNPIVGLVATTVAHELGHNFGMEHDDDNCVCQDEKCIMAPASSQTSPTHWSSCSYDHLKLAFEQGMDYCLQNKPTKIMGPVCGNGFVEEGEQCDCGLKKFCDNICCNASSCTLFANASCATGSCCDLHTCQVKPIATKCRAEENECDFPEYCDGKSEYCPADVYKHNGYQCRYGKAYCYDGKCRTHTDQCKLLWGPSGEVSNQACFQNNMKGTAIGNCGYFRVNQTYRSCSREDVLCGMLHCTHLNERLMYGMESVSILSRSFITEGERILTCRSAIVDLGLNTVDPGLVPDGASCGDNKVCVSQRCVPVASLKVSECPHDCSNNGACNSKGRCHCNNGYSPPYCDYPGIGGSEDSGPPRDPEATNMFVYAMYIIFLAIIPMLGISALFLYYYRGHIKTWWIVKARRRSVSKRAKDASKRRSRPVSTQISSKANFRALEISPPVATGNRSPVGVHGASNANPSLPEPNRVVPPNNVQLFRTPSVKATKFPINHQNSIRNLEISCPIPNNMVPMPASVSRGIPVRLGYTAGQNNVPTSGYDSHSQQKPAEHVPCRPAPAPPSVSRAASLRGRVAHSNSMRVKRLSGPNLRPANPPPRPPPPKVDQRGAESQQVYESVIYSEPNFDSLDKGCLKLLPEDYTTSSSKSSVAYSASDKPPSYEAALSKNEPVNSFPPALDTDGSSQRSVVSALAKKFDSQLSKDPSSLQATDSNACKSKYSRYR
ncbi:hypothetical protein CHUAL_008140 [Chamberlinius hualienensis]